MPSPNLGATTKHENHLRLLRLLTSDAVLERLLGARRFADVYEALRAMPSLGPFLAFQFATDLNYTSYLPFGEESFVVAGPGARDGIAKCFAGVTPREANEVIMWTYESQEDHLQRLGLHFDRLAGRPLQPIDCQNLYCEIGKYARAAFPGVPRYAGKSPNQAVIFTRRRRRLCRLSWSPVNGVTANWRSRRIAFEALHLLFTPCPPRKFPSAARNECSSRSAPVSSRHSSTRRSISTVTRAPSWARRKRHT